MRLFFLFTLSIVLTLAPVYANDQGAGKPAPRLAIAPDVTTYTDRSYGFSIGLIHGFRLVSEHAGILYFRSAESHATIMIKPRPGLSLANIQQGMRQGFQSKLLNLVPTGTPETLTVDAGQGMSMAIDGTIVDANEHRDIKGILAGYFGGAEQGYVVLISAPRERWQSVLPIAQPLLDSLAILPIESGFEHERWRQRLAGTRLIFISISGNVFNSAALTRDMALCGDGTFYQKDGTHNYGEHYWRAGYAYSSSRSSGEWRVLTVDGVPKLQMLHQKGLRTLAVLSEADGHIWLDNMPYRIGLNECTN